MNKTMQNTFPVIPVKNMLVFPHQTAPIRVGRKKSIAAVKAAQKEGYLVIHLQKNESKGEDVGPKDLASVGTICVIERVRGNAKDGYEVIIRGSDRFQSSEIFEKDGYIQAQGSVLEDIVDMDCWKRSNTRLVTSSKK
jgi:ATP-dependent Lon protease